MTYSQATCSIQFHENHIYCFGGSISNPNSVLSIYDTSKRKTVLFLIFLQGKNSMCEMVVKGDAPGAIGDCFSAVYDNKMFIFGGASQNMSSDNLLRNMKSIYWLNLSKCLLE